MRDSNGEELLVGYAVAFWREGTPYLGTIASELAPGRCSVILGIRDPETLLDADAEAEARELRRLALRGPGLAAERLARDLLPEVVEIDCDQLTWLPPR